MDFHLGWWIAGAIAFLIIWSSPKLKGLLILCLLLFVLIAACRSLFHAEACTGEESCMVDLEPTYAGVCFPTGGGAVLQTQGHYFLTSSDGGSGGAICFDWRIVH